MDPRIVGARRRVVGLDRLDQHQLAARPWRRYSPASVARSCRSVSTMASALAISGSAWRRSAPLPSCLLVQVLSEDVEPEQRVGVGGRRSVPRRVGTPSRTGSWLCFVMAFPRWRMRHPRRRRPQPPVPACLGPHPGLVEAGAQPECPDARPSHRRQNPSPTRLRRRRRPLRPAARRGSPRCLADRAHWPEKISAPMPRPRAPRTLRWA